MILGVSKYGVKVASLDQCVSGQTCSLRSAPQEKIFTRKSSVEDRSAVTERVITGVSVEQDVLHRHPLYLIVRMLCYDDGLGAGKNLLALKTTDIKQEECSIWVYQCSSSVSLNIQHPYLLISRKRLRK